MDTLFVTEECRGHVVEITYAQGILQKVPRGEDLEFSLIHLPTCLYNKYLLSIHPTLGLEIKWQSRYDPSPCGAPLECGEGEPGG